MVNFSSSCKFKPTLFEDFPLDSGCVGNWNSKFVTCTTSRPDYERCVKIQARILRDDPLGPDALKRLAVGINFCSKVQSKKLKSDRWLELNICRCLSSHLI